MAHSNMGYIPSQRQQKRSVKPPADVEQSYDVKRTKERNNQTWERTDKRQQWQGVEY